MTPPDAEPHSAYQVCLICGGQLAVIYARVHQMVLECQDCSTGITIPASAWEVVRLKRDKLREADARQN